MTYWKLHIKTDKAHLYHVVKDFNENMAQQIVEAKFKKSTIKDRVVGATTITG